VFELAEFFRAQTVPSETRTSPVYSTELPSAAAPRPIEDDEIEQGYRKTANRLASPAGRTRTAGLQILMARLDGFTFESAAGMLGLSVEQLRRYVQAEIAIPARLYERVTPLVEVLQMLHQVIDRRATARWFATPIPAAGQRTPRELVERRQLTELLAIVRRYVEPVEFV
jgi:transcriptional regulator with XRE-family HTH domain